MTIFLISVTFDANVFIVRWLFEVTLLFYLSLLSLTAKQLVLVSKMPSFALAKAIFAIAKQLVLLYEMISLPLRKPFLYLFSTQRSGFTMYVEAEMAKPISSVLLAKRVMTSTIW